MATCIHCNAPIGEDRKADHIVPPCGTIQRLDAARTPACLYIEELRRTAEDLDTAVMGLVSGIHLGGTHVTAPLGFAEEARQRYEKHGLYDLPEKQHG